MRKIELTQEQKDYNKENRIKMSMNQMATDLKISFYSVSNYMKKNNLKVDRETIYKNKVLNIPRSEPKRAEGYKKEQWVFDIWNRKINPITMFRV